MEYTKGLENLEKISQNAGKYPDMVQGGGGNTSAKLDDEIMAIKASGFKLKQVKQDEGFVRVNYKKILDYYQSINLDEDKDFVSESEKVVQNSIVDGQELRPSVETGFHSVLKKYVIHTHSVYANILACSQEGEELVKKIFSDFTLPPLWITYTHPGFFLTVKIREEFKKYRNQYGQEPEVIFMENHGLIVHSDDVDYCINLNKKVNQIIKDYFNIDAAYPEIQIEKIDEKLYVSHTKYLKRCIENRKISDDLFSITLYPDQLVYLGRNLAINSEGKISINTETGEILYKAKFNEAQTIDEILTAFFFITEQINKNNLTVKTMDPENIKLIIRMEDESYRKKILKNMD